MCMCGATLFISGFAWNHLYTRLECLFISYGQSLVYNRVKHFFVFWSYITILLFVVDQI